MNAITVEECRGAADGEGKGSCENDSSYNGIGDSGSFDVWVGGDKTLTASQCTETC